MKWISVNDGMPPEKDTIFSKYYGTEKWKPAMFRTKSEKVLATVEYEDGTRETCEACTHDGEWDVEYRAIKRKVLYWAPIPEPCWDDADICGATGIRCSNCQPVCGSRSEIKNDT